MPACTLGHRAVTLSAGLHYAVGTSTCPIVDVFNAHLQPSVAEARGRDVPNRHFAGALDGVLVTDFYRAYTAVDARYN